MADPIQGLSSYPQIVRHNSRTMRGILMLAMLAALAVAGASAYIAWDERAEVARRCETNTHYASTAECIEQLSAGGEDFSLIAMVAGVAFLVMAALWVFIRKRTPGLLRTLKEHPGRIASVYIEEWRLRGGAQHQEGELVVVAVLEGGSELRLDAPNRASAQEVVAEIQRLAPDAKVQAPQAR